MKELHGYETSVVTKQVEKNCSTEIANCVFVCLSEATCHTYGGQKTTSRVCPQFIFCLKQSLCSFPLDTPGEFLGIVSSFHLALQAPRTQMHATSPSLHGSGESNSCFHVYMASVYGH